MIGADGYAEGLEYDIIMSIRRNTNTGWPTGLEEFVKRLEGMLGVGYRARFQ